jgi:hypothetical protein
MLTENQLNQVNALRGKSLMLGGIGIAIAIVLGLFGGDAFQGLLIGYLLLFLMSITSLGLLMLHHLCGGSWSFVVQRIAEAGSRTLIPMAVIGAVVILGAAITGTLFSYSTVYPWANAEFMAQEGNDLIEHMAHLKHHFLNLNVFVIGYAVYFAIWILFMLAYNGWSKKLDETGDAKYIAKMKFWAGPGLVLYVLTMTFASTHWAMSTDPTFFSTIYGAWFIAGGALSMMCFCVLMLSWLSNEGPLAEKVSSQIYHHFGNFMLGFTIFWSYVSFSAFLIIWNGNLPEEIGWYLHRSGDWIWVMTVVLIAFVWFAPMFTLLHRKFKTNPNTLRWIAVYILGTRFIDMYWNIAPSYEGNHSTINLITLLAALGATVGMAGLWFWLFLGELKKRPLLPQQDPREELMFLKEKAHNHA